MYFQQERMTGSLRPPSTLVLSFPLHKDCEPCGCVYVPLHTHAHETYWCSQASPGTFHTASQNEPKLGSLTLIFKIQDARSLELFTATRASWEALQGTAQRFTELCQPPPRDKAVIHEGGTIKTLTMRPNERESVFLKTELAIVRYCLQASADRNTRHHLPAILTAAACSSVQRHSPEHATARCCWAQPSHGSDR